MYEIFELIVKIFRISNFSNYKPNEFERIFGSKKIFHKIPNEY